MDKPLTAQNLAQAETLITSAVKALGRLTVGQATDLLLDNMPQLADSHEAWRYAHAIVAGNLNA